MSSKFSFDDIYAKYASWVVNKSKAIIIVCFLIIALAAAGLKKIGIDGDVLQYFEKGNPQLESLEKIHDEYERTDNVLIVIEPKDKNVFTNSTLDIIEKITSQSWKAPFVTRVDAITNFQYTRSSNDELKISDLVENAKSKTPEELKQIKAIALAEEDLVKRLISPSGHVAGIFLTVKLPKKDFLNEGPVLVENIRSLVKKYESQNIKIYLTGTVFVDQAFAEAGKQDMETLIPLMYFLMLFVLAYFLRSTLGIFSSLFITLVAVIVALGVVSHMGIPINPVTSVTPTMIITIVIADAIHFFMTTINFMKEGHEKKEAIRNSIVLNFKAFFLKGITTILGFLCLNYSDSPPFQELGNIVSLGILSGWVLSILWLPAFLMLIPFKVNPIKNKKKEFNYEKFAIFVFNYKKTIIGTTVVLSLLIIPFIFKNIINDMFLDFFDEELTIRKDTEFTVQNLTGVYSIEYSLGAGKEGGVSEIEYLKKVEEFENWFKKQEKVIHVNSFPSVIRKLNKIMHGDDPSYNSIPNDSKLSAQYLLLYEMSLPYGRDLNNMINMDKSATRFRVTFENMYTEDLKKIELAANDWLRKNAPEYMYFNGTSTSVMFRYLSERNIQNMLYGYFSALLVIGIIMILATKSIKLGLISLIPNILPTVLAFGLWGFFVGKVGLSVAFVTSFTSGIVVDDTIHFFIKYLRGRKKLGYSPKEAVVYTFKTVGNSMFVSTVILVIGFLVLVFSPFENNAAMGTLCALTVFIALICDFFLTPALVLIFDKEKHEKKPFNIQTEERERIESLAN